ncbi:MAG TPA: hypothetical protein VFB28_07465 [Terriglobales bacterium]|jgi:hypothetical protein|nr:hypothetical protein [Terriglobales bacterium]
MELTISSSERELLREILEEHHRELLREISRAEHHQFKEALKGKEKLLERMLEKLNSAQPIEVLLHSA